jgi:nascent polypeptide-associated complex subunit alpha
MFGGGMNPRKMQQMMEQMGIDMSELDAEEVVIRLPDEELVFADAEVTRMDAQGTQTYQIAGEPESRPRGSGESTDADQGADDAPAVSDDDVEIVVMRTGASEETAREALAAEDGDLAAAVSRLE